MCMDIDDFYWNECLFVGIVNVIDFKQVLNWIS